MPCLLNQPILTGLMNSDINTKDLPTATRIPRSSLSFIGAELMAWWVYKCNSRNREYQNAYGDWDQFFDDPEEHWGKSEWVPELARLKVGDYIIAYQTNRNKIVGLTRVRQSCEQDGCLYLTPLKRIGGKVRPLKKDAAIASIKAFQPGPVHTIYSLTKEEAERLLEAI